MNNGKKIHSSVKKQMQRALLLACAVTTFAVPAIGGGYNALKEKHVISSAAAIEDVDLQLVGASAFGEARKVINASYNDDFDIFVANTETIIGHKWQNIGLLVGAREGLSGTTWTTYQSPVTMSTTEVATYNNNTIKDAYDKYKAFGFAVQNLNKSAQKSRTSAVSIEEGLDTMSTAAIKLGNLGTQFLTDYNPGPVLLSLYDSSNLATYANNKLVQIVTGNDVLKNVICLFGDQVPGTGVSFFLILNAVLATVGLLLSMFLTLLGNRTVGDAIKQFLVRIVIATVGIYLVSNLMSKFLTLINDTVFNLTVAETAEYVENNLNLYDWYQTGFSLPSTVKLKIDASGNFCLSKENIRAINEYTYKRLIDKNVSDSEIDNKIRARMETMTQNENQGTASFVTPLRQTEDRTEGASWSTDAYYAIMDNYAQNKEDLLDGKDEEGSPLADVNSVRLASQYFYMSALKMDKSGNEWEVSGFSNHNSSYYGLNPISALNLVRSDFSGEVITATSTVYPPIGYVAFDAVNVVDPAPTTPQNMNSILRFIACFTLVMAAVKGMISIFTNGFGNILAGGVKTSFGSSHGLGQAIGGVLAVFGGLIGISVIMSMTLSMLDTLYGISIELVTNAGITDTLLLPITDAIGGIPVIGSMISGFFTGGVNMFITLILALTFPKLGAIPITVFAQFMGNVPGQIAERAQMIESSLMNGRSSAGGGLGRGGHGSGQYGQKANAMANKALTSGTKQAVGVVAGAAAAGASIAGAAMSTAGKALNKKADNIEGKPQNPGIKNWDDMTPEQQAKAAEAAQATENWGNMDEEARQEALREAGVYDQASADGGGMPEGADTEAATGGEPAAGSGETLEGGSGEETSADTPADASADGMPAESVPAGPVPSEVPQSGSEASVTGQLPEGRNVAAPGMESSMSAAAGTVSGSGQSGSSQSGESHTAGTTAAAGGAQTGGATQPESGTSQSGQETAGNAAAYGNLQGQHIEGTSDATAGAAVDAGGSGTETASLYTGDTASGTDESSGQLDNHSGSESAEAAAPGETTQYSSLTAEGSQLHAGNQQFQTTVDQKNHMEAKSVDESRQLNTENVENDQMHTLDGVSSREQGGMENLSGAVAGAKGLSAAAGQAAHAGMPGTAPAAQGLSGGSGTGQNSHGTQQNGASATYKSVNQQNQTGGNSSTTVGVNSRQTNQFHGGVDQSRTMNNAEAKDPTKAQESQNLTGSSVRQKAQQAAGSSGRTMNQPNTASTSAWGKQMTIREQRQARALHAAGDALQMIGGNRTMSQGVMDALGHAKDAAISYTVPDELGASTVLTNVRVRRMEQQQRRNNRNRKR